MYSTINMSQIFVLDQDKARDFYVDVLGLEVSNDLDLGFMRWLTVCVPGTKGRDVLLEKPGPPGMDAKSADMVRELVTKGATGFTLGLTTDNIQKTYETLKARGVEFTQEPTTQSYGTDIGIRDPFGNNIRIVQLAETMGKPPASRSSAANAKSRR
ncbi:MAG: VOC family protein [Chloroflexi bacterium]|nr:MAG: VOC family protein [Chloroflexota bacterium]